MKKSTFALLVACAVVGVSSMSFEILEDTGKAGKTGSPGENTCVTGCHSGFMLNDGTGSVSISSPDLINWEYMPGDTYNINVTVARTGNGLFGLGTECLTSDAVPQNAGTLIITNSAETHILSATVNTVSRKNVVHQLNGGLGTNSKTFSFKWRAPLTNVGNVTFYVAGNAANGNGLKTGDHIYTTNQVVVPAPGASVSNVDNSTRALAIYPNPATDNFNLQFNSAAGENITIEMISVDGKMFETLYSGIATGTSSEIKLSVPANFNNGVYFIRVLHGAEVAVSRLAVTR